MTVIVNFQSNTVKVEGSLEDIRKYHYDSDHIDM
jgi:hypothetical protein